jgi:hypothetical protein
MAYIQSNSGGGTTSDSVALTVSQGNTIVAFAWVGSNFNPTLHSVADGQGTYGAIGSVVTDSSNNIWSQVYTLENANAGLHTITFTSDSGADLFLVVAECSAPTSGATIGAIGQFQASVGTTADALTSTSITIAAPAALLAMTSDTSNVNTADCPAAGTGFTSQAFGASSAIGSWRLESQAVSANAAGTFTAIVGSSRFLTHAIAILDGTGGGAPAPGPLLFRRSQHFVNDVIYQA